MANLYELEYGFDRGAIDRARSCGDAVAPLVDEAVHDLDHVDGGLAADVMDLMASE